MKKTQRHQVIKEIIKNHNVRTQEELLELLNQQGISATQATISRDIRDLKIVKVKDENQLTHFELFVPTKELNNQFWEEQRLIEIVRDVVVAVEHVEFLTIIHTSADNAQLVCSIIDNVELPNVVATLAGFDVVIIISKSEKEAITIEKYFKGHLVNNLENK